MQMTIDHGYFWKEPLSPNTVLTAASPAPMIIPACTQLGMRVMIFLPKPVMPRNAANRPKLNSNAISACTRSGPLGNALMYNIKSGIAGVTQPGTTGSPNKTCVQ